MYKKEEVFNIRNSDYELTPVDEKIYEEIGYVLHQVDKNRSVHSQIVYKEHFGTILSQKLIKVNTEGRMEAGMWFLDRYCEKDYEELDLTEKEKELLKLKYEELIKGYWKEQKGKNHK